jgi:MerR family transcriptional regulator, light-induced transcriptional regulator
MALGWLREQVAAVRARSRNPALVVMVGGPLFHVHPEWVAEVGADLCPVQVHDAPVQAAERVRQAQAQVPLAR